MLQVHRAVAVVVLVLAVVGAVWGLVAYRRGRAGPTLGHVLALTQTALIAQVALGLLLLSDHHRARDRLHYLYGTLALAAVLSPWIYAPSEPRRRLAWFAGATLVAAALAGRAYMTAS
jgi:zinc transporter ZupT